MSQSVPAFQSELLQKIQFKASSKVSMDAFLFKSFKFFDLYNNGWLNKSDFFKSIAKCGVVVDTHVTLQANQNIDQIYGHYAAEDGKIYYKQFIEELLFREDEIQSNASRLKQSQQNVSPHQQLQNKNYGQSRKQENEPVQKLGESKINHIYNKCQTYAQVLDFIKRSIQVDGLGSLLLLSVNLKSIDTKKTHLVNKKGLLSLLNFMTQDTINLVFQQLSDNGNDIDYSVLIYDLKGQVEEDRVKEIQNVFNDLDDRREGEFPINYLLSRFLSKLEGASFKKAVELYSKFQGIDDGVFTEDDFLDFMGFLSFDYASNEQFKKHIIRAFYEEDTRSVTSQRSNRSRDFQESKGKNKQQINNANSQAGDFRKNKEVEENKGSIHEDHFDDFPEEHHEDDKKSVSRYSQIGKKDVPNNHLKQIQSIVLRIKKRLASKGTKGFLLFQKAMKNADIDRDTLLNYQQFKQVIKEQRIDITTTECSNIFDVFDDQGTGLIGFPEFMFALRGKMPENRRALTDKLWNQIRQSEQTSNFAQVKHCLNFRSHPDVQTGRKFQQDIWKQIQQTILTIQQLNGAPRSDTISKMQFQEYLQNLSLSILDDKLFESVLFNFWKLNTSANILDKYAGSRKLFDPSKNGYLMDHHRGVVKGGSVSQNAPFGTSVEPTNYFTQHRKL